MFYSFINGKMKAKESIIQLKENIKVYKNLKQKREVLNKNFQKVVTTESDFKKPQGHKNQMEYQYTSSCTVVKKRLNQFMI